MFAPWYKQASFHATHIFDALYDYNMSRLLKQQIPFWKVYFELL